jgi:restriction system protein
LSEADKLGILAANGGKDAWTKFNEQLWIRSDGASANFDSSRPRTLWIQGNKKVAQQAPAPAVASTPSFATKQVSAENERQVVGSSPKGIHENPAQNLPKRSQRRNTVESPTAVAKPPSLQTPPVVYFFVVLVLAALFGVPAYWRFYGVRRSLVKPTPEYAEIADAPLSPPTINSITWDQFELAVGEIYRRHGYEVEICSGLGADGGVDVMLSRDSATTLVQCKQWKSSKVGVKEVREFYGVLVSEGATRGIFISTAEYSRDAKDFAAGKPIDLLTGQDIRQLVSVVERPGENLWDIHQWLDEFIANSRIIDPRCPYCRELMVLRRPDRGTPFWSCRVFPRCRGKREARLEVIKARSFQPKG